MFFSFLFLFSLATFSNADESFQTDQNISKNAIFDRKVECTPIKHKTKISNPIPSKNTSSIEQEITVYCNMSCNQSPCSKNEPKNKNDNPPIWKEVIELISNILGNLWPLVTFVTVLLFRKDISNLISKLKKGKIGSAEFEFAEILNDIESLDIDLTSTENIIDDTTIKNANSNPRSTIIDAWLEIETALKNTPIKQKRYVKYNKPRDTIYMLQNMQLLPENYVALFHDLRVMRNQAAHDVDFNIDSDMVIKYVQLAQELKNEITKIASKYDETHKDHSEEVKDYMYD